MRRGAGIAMVRGLPAVVIVAVAGTLAASAPAEQAGQPASASAGRLDLGKYHSCFVLPNASVRCWGYGGNGALGYASTATIGDDETPAAAGPVDLGAGRTAVAIAAGAVHTCALQDDAAVRCWGFGGDGRLGYGSTASLGDDEAPGSVGPVDLGAGRTAKAITAGRGQSCALLDDDSVRCWGFGFDGRLGSGTMNSIGDDETPGSVAAVKLGAGRTAKAITTGDAHTCAVLDDGSVRCWGYGADGALGYGNKDSIGDNETPDTVVPVNLGAGRKAVAISAGDYHTCAVLDNGAVRCWGYGGDGRLGYRNADSIGDNETPDTAGPVDLGAGRTALAISGGGGHTCALLDNARVRCWGYGADGQLGYASTNSIGDDETPGAVGPVDLGAGRTAVAISAGDRSTCAGLDDGTVRCWGQGASGRLGSCSATTIGDDETPGSAGPVDLGIPGSPGAACRTIAPAPTGAPGPYDIPPGHAGPTPDTPPPPGDGPDPEDPGAALAAQRARAKALRACLRHVSGKARRAARLRPRAQRRITRRAARGRQRCRRRHGRIPGRVTGVSARGLSPTRILLSFRAPGTDGSKPPAAHAYLVKESSRPIRGVRRFKRAQTLCGGNCRFSNSRVGARITLTITDLRPHTTYHYAIAARDNVSRRTGPHSKSVAADTR